jgi:hypothetical protein
LYHHSIFLVSSRDQLAYDFDDNIVAGEDVVTTAFHISFNRRSPKERKKIKSSTSQSKTGMRMFAIQSD